MNYKKLGLVLLLSILVSCSGKKKHFDVKVNEMKSISTSEKMMSINSDKENLNGYVYINKNLGNVLIMAENEESFIQIIGLELSIENDFQNGLNQIVDVINELGNENPELKSEIENWLNHSFQKNDSKATFKNGNIKLRINQIKDKSVSLFISPK